MARLSLIVAALVVGTSNAFAPSMMKSSVRSTELFASQIGKKLDKYFCM